MSQALLLLAVLAVLGVYGVRWTQRLAPLTSELPLKTLFATALCALTAGLALTQGRVTLPLLVLALFIGPLYVLAPFALTALARGRLYRAAATLADLLYWTPAGRTGMGRLIVQVALQQADAETALALLPEGGGDLLRAQAYALLGRWRDLLALELPDVGDNAFLGRAARAEAHLALGDEEAAEAELRSMEQRWQARGQGPLGYRSVKLTQARLHAYRGNLAAAQQELQTPLPGVPPYRVLEILAAAAERADNPQAAAQFYTQAYAYAPPTLKPRLKGALTRYGGAPAEAPRTPSLATFSLAASLVALYLAQVWVDGRYGDRTWSLVAGFLTLNPDAPGALAPWRYLSYAFVHGGFVHIGLNTWVLIDIGRLYESRRPWGSLLMAFVFGTAMGAYLTFVSQGGGPPGVVGASGGVLGVAGALLADTWRGQGPRDRALTRALVQWVVLIVLFSLAIPNVSLWGHIGGLIGGLLWGFARQGLPKTRRLDLAAGVLSLALLGYALAASLRWLEQYGPQL